MKKKAHILFCRILARPPNLMTSLIERRKPKSFHGHPSAKPMAMALAQEAVAFVKGRWGEIVG
jgi:hypothetical protein